jgi:probable rRNA maturation factor
MSARIHLSVPPGTRLPRRLLTEAVEKTLDSEGVEEGEIAVVFLRDGPIRALNRDWLGHDRVTDVLSFPLHDPGAPPFGDVYVGLEQAKRQAKKYGVSRDEELVRLVVHGTLHILGYDHAPGASVESGGALFSKQEALVHALVGATGGARGTRGPKRVVRAKRPSP